jgi:DNA repair exonuclease SbcCD ATPase subunit
MTGITVYQRLASVCAVVFGKYGDVTRQAKARKQSRQALYREADEVVAALGADKSQARIAELEQSLAAASARLKATEARLQRAVEITPERQAEYASKAEAIGVSLSASRELLTVFMKEQTPSVAQLGRYTRAAGKNATALLQVLDELTRPLVKQAAADEIFFW